jgi:hypothetical protein
VTNQQIADHDLSLWQGLPRGLTAAEKMDLLFYDFLMPPLPGDVEYSATMRRFEEALQEECCA